MGTHASFSRGRAAARICTGVDSSAVFGISILHRVFSRGGETNMRLDHLQKIVLYRRQMYEAWVHTIIYLLSESPL